MPGGAGARLADPQWGRFELSEPTLTVWLVPNSNREIQLLLENIWRAEGMWGQTR